MSAPWPQGNHIDSFFPPRIGAATPVATDFDNDGRWRKRRRTGSPEARSPTLNGNATAYGATKVARAAHSMLSSSRVQRIVAVDQPGSISADLRPEGNHVPAKGAPCEDIEAPSVVIKDSATAWSTPPSQLSVDEQPSLDKRDRLGDTTVSIKVPRGSEAPSVKLIKARPDGKLTSPKTLRRSDRQAENSGAGNLDVTTRKKDPRRQGYLWPEGRSNFAKPRDNAVVSTSDTGPSVPTVTESTVQPSKEATPPKKLMKIRSDGKLVSPSTNTQIPGTPTKRRGRPRKSVNDTKPKIVIMKYGKTVELRHVIGKRIQDIFANSRSLEESGNPCRRAGKPPEAVKATHPFFLEKPRWKPQSDLLGLGDKDKTDAPDEGENGLGSKKNPPEMKPSRNILTRVNAKPHMNIDAPDPHPTRSSGYVARALRGAHDPLWPPQDMVHVRPGNDITPISTRLTDGTFSRLPKVSRLKSTESHVRQEEEVMLSSIRLVQAGEAKRNETGPTNLPPAQLRLPLRRITTGHELQNLYKEKTTLPSSSRDRLLKAQYSYVDELSDVQHQQGYDHTALEHLYKRITTSRTAFDRFECERDCWTTKYAPQKAEHVLQPGREALILRDWLRSLVVHTVGSGSNDAGSAKEPSRIFMKPDAATRKKKRIRAQELDGFVVSSDDEANEMDELHDNDDMASSRPNCQRNAKSVIKVREVANLMGNSGIAERSTNAVLISGPSGSGKTAAVHAAAQELGFEVFEINAGSRRSGKDIFDKVGDMSRNHLVSQVQTKEAAQTNLPDDRLPPSNDLPSGDLESHGQFKLNAFLQPKAGKTKSPKKKRRLKQKDASNQFSKQRSQKQSVILLEEVDLLFEDDKLFWAATMELIMQSKRPVIMTCTEESLVPLADLSLFGILRFVNPPAQLAIEYLLLLACNEGHLLSRDTISALYDVKCSDLRASMTELQFYCQMAVGDTKGGLEWMLIQPSIDQTVKSASISERVVSDGTYFKGMGWSDHEQGGSDFYGPTNYELDLLTDICSGWKVDLAEEDDFLPIEAMCSKSANSGENLGMLDTLDVVYDSLSAADTLHCRSFRDGLRTSLDCSAPQMPDKDRLNYIEGPRLLQADQMEDPRSMGDSIAAALRVFARRCLLSIANEPQSKQLNEQLVAEDLPAMLRLQHRPKPVNSQTISNTFIPLSRPSLGPSAGRGPLISSFDSPTAVVVEDIAPYVRAIVSYDLRLEEQRKRLDTVSHGGRSGKRVRTTRASRAALEGGSKANTRRERWFPANTDFRSVLRTGESGWQKELSRRCLEQGLNDDGNFGSSRRSSISST
ncbi:MAG: hypothetical protein Q9220_003544 [cf. Caloplaca sp. 1 TL-2023]